MSETTTIRLTKPLEGPAGEITEISLRCPGYAEYMSIGEPFVGAGLDGANYQVVNDDAVRAYVETCANTAPAILRKLSLDDARAIRSAMLDFFLRPPPTPTTTSSEDPSSATGDEPGSAA